MRLSPSQYTEAVITFCTDSPARFRVLIPVTAKLLERGLQGFDRPGKREGMMFLSTKWPDEEVIPMWMAKVPYPLAMIWISGDGRITRIERDVQPGDKKTYSQRGIACIEISAEVPSEVGLRVGTKYTFSEIC